jgi:hypothetical protein
MATQTVDWGRQLLTATLSNMTKSLADQTFCSDPLVALLTEGGQVRTSKGGDGITYMVDAAVNDGSSVQSFDCYDDVPLGNNNTLGQVRFPWRSIVGGVKYCETADAINNSPQAIVNLVQYQIEKLKKDFRVYMARSVAGSDGTGNNNKDMFGLPAIVGGAIYADPEAVLGGSCVTLDERPTPVAFSNPSLGSYRLEDWRELTAANPATAWWSSYIDDGGYAAAAAAALPLPASRPITFDDLARVIGSLDQCTPGRRVALMGKDLYYGFLALVNGTNGGVVSTNGTMVKLGFESFTYMGMTFIWSCYIAPDMMYLLNLDHLFFNVNSNMYFKQTDWKQPTNQLAYYMQVALMANMTTDMRRAHAKLCNIKSIC